MTEPENKESLDAIEYHKFVTPRYNDETIAEEIKRHTTEIGSEEAGREFSVFGSYADILRRMSDANTQQSRLIADALKLIEDKTLISDGFEKIGDDGYSLKNSLLNIDRTFKGEELSGKEAKMFILARNNNIRKIPLYNSGFSIVLRAPKLVDINIIYNRLGSEFNEYGRMLGGLFYMYSDMKIKEILFEFIEMLTINSNLKNWDKGTRLMNHISINDYQLILLQIAILMHKNGYPFKEVCFKCKNIREENIDLSLLQLTDFSRIPEDLRKWMSEGNIVDTKDLEKYREKLNLSESFDISDYRIKMKIPSIGTYTKYGNSYNDEMAKSIHDFTDIDVIQQYLKYGYCSIYLPWIESISVISEDRTNVNFVVRDQDSIVTVLNEIQSLGLSDTFGEKMSDFITRSSITNIGYIGTPCSKCGENPPNAINGIIPVDIQNSFFSVLVMRLLQN